VDNSGLDKLAGRLDKLQAQIDERLNQIMKILERKAE